MANSGVEVRSLTAGDVEGTARAAGKVGWPDKERQISFFHKHPNGVGFVAETMGEIVGASFGVENGAVGWLGLIFALPGLRGHGLGTSLTHAVMVSLEEPGCRTLLLVATDMGQPLYERLGFEVETNYHGFVGPGDTPEIGGFHPISSENLREVHRLDRRVTGEDRSRLLESMRSGWVLIGEDNAARAYHMAAPWGGGPVIASDSEAGVFTVELRRAVAGPEGLVRVWLTEENVPGREYMEEIGFEEIRVSPRMVRGERVEWKPEDCGESSVWQRDRHRRSDRPSGIEGNQEANCGRLCFARCPSLSPRPP